MGLLFQVDSEDNVPFTSDDSFPPSADGRAIPVRSCERHATTSPASVFRFFWIEVPQVRAEIALSLA
jgi:hypothetical protein